MVAYSWPGGRPGGRRHRGDLRRGPARVVVAAALVAPAGRRGTCRGGGFPRRLVGVDTTTPGREHKTQDEEKEKKKK